MRRAICWAIVPLGMKTAAGLPSSSRTSVSRAVTTPPEPYVVGGQLLGRQRSELGEHVGGAAQPVPSKRTLTVVLQSRALVVRQCVGADHGSSVAWSGWRSMIGSPSHCAAGAAQ